MEKYLLNNILINHFIYGILLIIISLSIGTFGYSRFGKLSTIDALMNASMVFTGMGPVDKMATTEAKLFATFFALYSGLVFITALGIFIGPSMPSVLKY